MLAKTPKNVGEGYPDIDMYVEESTSGILSSMQITSTMGKCSWCTLSARWRRVSTWRCGTFSPRHIRKSLNFFFLFFYILFSFICLSSSSSSILLRSISIAYFYYFCSFFVVFLFKLCVSMWIHKHILWCSRFWLYYYLKGYSETTKLKWKRKRKQKRTLPAVVAAKTDSDDSTTLLLSLSLGRFWIYFCFAFYVILKGE